ncbi:MAG: hypothetical protein KJZ84_19330 [Bryobacteraceae bacterium]|nr:hypothetical protein [Bryobacteraceae bacterium]
MQTHVKVLAWLNVVLGGMGVVFALGAMASAQWLAQVLHDVNAEFEVPLALIQVVVTVILGTIMVSSLPCLILGFGLLNFRPWARILGLLLCALLLLNFPFGTAVALYGFWVLLKPETEALFQPAGATNYAGGSRHPH